MSHLERKIREKEAIRNSILEAAKAIAAKEGWHSVTIRKIADAIEYTPPIVYEYFENKEDLIKELIYSGFEILGTEFKKIFNNDYNPKIILNNDYEPKILLKKLSLLHWDFAINNKVLYQLMFSIERPTPNNIMLENVKYINNLFFIISNNNKLLADELIFNWICLMDGAISFLLFFPPTKEIIDMEHKKLFKNIIKRFIDSI
jgi:AcrR family transcriptional regulator